MWSGVQSVTYSPQTHCATILDFGTFGGAQLWEPQENKILWIAIQCSGHYFSSLYALKDLYGCILEKAMAPHSSTLAWKIPWMEEPGRLQSMGSLRVRHNLSDFTFTFHFHALEKEMATHSSVLAWRIQGTGEPGGLPSMGSHRFGHDWSDLAAAAAVCICQLQSPNLFPSLVA